jgi:hypothetical protein
MRTKLLILIILILTTSIVLANKIDGKNLIVSDNSTFSKTDYLKYDNDSANMYISMASYFNNEPFENGFGFWFNINDFSFLSNVDSFNIVEISALLEAEGDPNHYDKESRQGLCGGTGTTYDGPKSYEDVYFAVPHGGIPVEPGFKGWKAYTSKDGSWGKDDGAKYDYNGLPFNFIKSKNGVVLWVALTQVKSDGYLEDYDVPYHIGLCQIPGHCYIGTNYYWQNYQQHLTCMIRCKVEYPGADIDSSSIGIIRALYR